MAWVTDLDSIIFTRIKYELEKELKAKYTDLYITNSDKSPNKVRFPTVYIQNIGNPESGKTLEAMDVNAVQYTLQIQVSAKKQDDVREVSEVLEDVLADMMFTVVMFPYPQNTDDLFGSVSRFRRMIARDDIL